MGRRQEDLNKFKFPTNLDTMMQPAQVHPSFGGTPLAMPNQVPTVKTEPDAKPLFRIVTLNKQTEDRGPINNDNQAMARVEATVVDLPVENYDQ